MFSFLWLFNKLVKRTFSFYASYSIIAFVQCQEKVCTNAIFFISIKFNLIETRNTA
nr:MAG TPA: hypothetical protein [Caudoviricetes sp.]